jgi:hypothetical protein
MPAKFAAPAAASCGIAANSSSIFHLESNVFRKSREKTELVDETGKSERRNGE